MDSTRPDGTVSRAEALATIVVVFITAFLSAAGVTYVVGLLGR